MQIFNSLEDIKLNKKTAVALGNFDGLHIGHRVVMEDAVSTAREKGLLSLCFTFSNHPFNFILRRSDDDEDAVKLICTEEEKVKLVENMGFDVLVNIPFDETVMTMKADAFFDDIICGYLNAEYISVGFNYTYGARAEGRPYRLIESCEKAGIGVTIHDAVVYDDKVVSSTLIREMIKEGNMELTAAYLGRPYSFEGKIVHGKSIGSRNGIPTINIPAPARQMLPPNGVYFSRVSIDGKEYSSVSNIGVNPTIADNNAKTIETYILDFDRDVYGSDVVVYFDHFSRKEQKFSSREELFGQITRDCENAADFHRKR